MTAAASLRTGEASPLIRVEGVAKAFGETRALRDGNLVVRPGTVHAIIGENGSGKSTLVKILTGVVQPDAGTLWLDGRAVRFGKPADARAAGIATTFQEILVLEDLTLLDNLWLGQDRLFRVRIPADRRRAEAEAIMRELTGSVPDLGARVADLDLGTRQAAVIARSLLLSPRLLILDEATAALDIAVRDRLFAAVRRRVAAGLSVLFITHKMDEIAALADEVTVLRSGETVATLPVAEATPARMLELMSGRTESTRIVSRGEGQGATVLMARDLRLVPAAEPFAIDIPAGGILGLGGLEGHGADPFAEMLGGFRSPAGGAIMLPDGTRLSGPRAFVRHGVVYVPRDRKREGIFAPLSIADNFAIATVGRYARAGLLDDGRAGAAREPLFARLGVKFGRLADPITSLSGGNQQKVILARMLALKPKVLVLNDPTRGVDLATKHDIYGMLDELAAAGVAVVLHSTEIEELLAVCHRVGVFHDSTLFRVFAQDELTREALIAGLFGRTP
jgi:ABC-type sugar transport system ATPase subunit